MAFANVRSMRSAYSGPLRDEPPALELHNTVYATRGELIDGLATEDELGAWLAGISGRLPERARGAAPSRREDFLALWSAIRDVFAAALEAKPVPARALEAINAIAARAPTSPEAIIGDAGRLRADTRYHAADPTDVALAFLAADAISLLTGPHREHLGACRAPGCVLMFLRDHPRRRWCSETCGNRARQARHYERIRGQRRDPRGSDL
jgi:predicted RNA-binding Zn ribbon-like protein